MQQVSNKYVVIVAGGKGLRLNQPLPKQFILLKNKPILAHTLQAFSFDSTIKIILVLPNDNIEYWQKLCTEHHIEINHTIVAGGETRFYSVKNGLNAIHTQNGLVAIHDGVRPFITKEIINASFQNAQKYGCAVTSVKLKDSIRELTITGKTKNVNRNNFYLVQTPQVFDLKKIKDAYNLATHDNFTDDASVFEDAGNDIHLIEGSYSNIKITTKEDLLIAQALLNN